MRFRYHKAIQFGSISLVLSSSGGCIPPKPKPYSPQVIHEEPDRLPAAKIPKDHAFLAAEAHLEALRLDERSGWTKDSKIHSRVAIYSPGRRDPTHYEYKVVTGAEDSGSILVQTDGHRAFVSDLTTTGLALHDKYSAALAKDSPFKIYRHGLMENVAISSGKIVAFQNSRSRGRVAVLGRRREVEGQSLQELEAHHVRVKELNLLTFPRLPRLASKAPPRDELTRPRKYREYFYLRHQFPRIGQSTPQWWQVEDGRGYPVGCGAVAWGIALAYWHQHKNRGGLFDFSDISKYGNGAISNTPIEVVLWSLADDLETTFGGKADKHGRVQAKKMSYGVAHASRQGYPAKRSNVHRKTTGWRDKWRLATLEIQNDRPAILHIRADYGGTTPDHYVVAEGTSKLFTSLGYLVNYGWGPNDPLRWIYDGGPFSGWVVSSVYSVHIPPSQVIPCPADYDGDGMADMAVKNSAGIPAGRWSIDLGGNGFDHWDLSYAAYGANDARPVPADYDGDHRADLSVKVDDGRWLIDFAANGFGLWDQRLDAYGGSDARPAPADYDGDGRADLSVKVDDGRWLIDFAANGFGRWDKSLNAYGGADAHAVPADYDGDGRADLSVKVDDGCWMVDFASDGFGRWESHWCHSDLPSNLLQCPPSHMEPEVCDGHDNDCDGLIDEDCDSSDDIEVPQCTSGTTRMVGCVDDGHRGRRTMLCIDGEWKLGPCHVGLPL